MADLGVLECTISIAVSGTVLQVCSVGIIWLEELGEVVIIDGCEVGEYLFCSVGLGSLGEGSGCGWGMQLWVTGCLRL